MCGTILLAPTSSSLCKSQPGVPTCHLSMSSAADLFCLLYAVTPTARPERVPEIKESKPRSKLEARPTGCRKRCSEQEPEEPAVLCTCTKGVV